MMNAFRFLKYAVPAALLLAGGAHAQSAGELNIRMSQIEDQMRQLMGQVEQLSFEMRETRKQLARIGGEGGALPAKRKLGAIEPQPLPADTIEAAPLATPPKRIVADQGVEQIEDPLPSGDTGGQIVATDDNAPGPQILGQLPGGNSAAKPDDGGFQGVIVDPGSDATVRSETDVETVALGTPSTDTAESLYEHSYESLLRRQFGDAEGGFRAFLGRYREHSLAGNAQFWLGETYYVQGDYRQAAQSFLSGYQEFPKSRKAPDSLLKLGLSLNRLGQTQQACAALLAVGDKFPKAAEAKKRAAKEASRAGC